MTDAAETPRPASAAPDLLINRRDLRSFEVHEASRPQIDEGQVALAVERFGLTSNNLTYALSGKAMGYWDFFPAENGWGRMPVWGFAEIIGSSFPELPTGTRLFGLLPPSSYAVLEPGAIAPWGFEDQSPHRIALPEVYNTYLRVARDPLHTPDSEGQLAVMRMLFTTAYMLADSVADMTAGAFPVPTVYVSSASSKTALALAYELRRRGHADLIGLTSNRNAKFVRDTGAFDQVVIYDDVPWLPVKDAIYVDFAGNGSVRHAIHERLGEQLLNSIVVGVAHWDRTGEDRIQRRRGGAGEEAFAFQPGSLPGPTPEFFFAGDPIARHVADAGVLGLWELLAEPWRSFLAWTDRWLGIELLNGSTGIAVAYQAIVNGELDPSMGIVIEP
jgi:hypothetical protein